MIALGLELERRLAGFCAASGAGAAVTLALPARITGARTVAVIYDEVEGLGYYKNVGDVLAAFESEEPTAASPADGPGVPAGRRDFPAAAVAVRPRLPGSGGQRVREGARPPGFSRRRDGDALLRRHKADFLERPPNLGASIVSERLGPLSARRRGPGQRPAKGLRQAWAHGHGARREHKRRGHEDARGAKPSPGQGVRCRVTIAAPVYGDLVGMAPQVLECAGPLAAETWFAWDLGDVVEAVAAARRDGTDAARPGRCGGGGRERPGTDGRAAAAQLTMLWTMASVAPAEVAESAAAAADRVASRRAGLPLHA